jgi:hypothetical protein
MNRIHNPEPDKLGELERSRYLANYRAERARRGRRAHSEGNLHWTAREYGRN